MHKIYFLIQFAIILLLSSKLHSLSSSSYLIANSAISFYDYDKANNYFNTSNLNHFNNSDLQKKLLTFVNANFLNKANIVAKEIIRSDLGNQEAWLVYLINAKLDNLSTPFDQFHAAKQKNNLQMVDFIFFDSSKRILNNDEIAKSIFSVISSFDVSNETNILQNYDYLLFYLSLCLNLNQSFNESYFYIAQIYEQLKNYEKAEEFYKKVHESHQLFIESQINIALNKRSKKNIVEAEKDLILLIKNNQKNFKLLVGLADLYRVSKQYKKAINYYSIALKNLGSNFDKSWRILYMRGICYDKINNWKSAEEDFLDALDINSDSSQVLNYLAYAWIEKNTFLNKSLKMLEKAHNNNPSSHYILDSLAWAHFKKNNFETASTLMEEVISRAPAEVISLDHLGDIYFAMGRKREAIFMWRQAKDLAEPEDEILESLKIKLIKYNAG